MGDHRMFSKKIITAGKFLRMPPTARLLYYDLGMAADDDGIVEAYTVMNQTKATEDDLRILIAKGYVKILNEELVAYICDWRINNIIKSDRYHPSIYKDLLLQLTETEEIPEGLQIIGTKVEPAWNQSGTKAEPEVKLSKVKLSNKKDIVGKPDYAGIIAYLNEKAGTSYKAGTGKTQQCINARYNEGFTLEDFKIVIDKKVEEWTGSDMEKYLRPETLFGPKFESYLNARIIKPKSKANQFTSHQSSEAPDFEALKKKIFVN